MHRREEDAALIRRCFSPLADPRAGGGLRGQARDQPQENCLKLGAWIPTTMTLSSALQHKVVHLMSLLAGTDRLAVSGRVWVEVDLLAVFRGQAKRASLSCRLEILRAKIPRESAHWIDCVP